MFKNIDELRKMKTYSHYDYFFKIAAYSHFDGDNKWALRLKAQGIAESGLTMTENSESGAYGVMQILPSTFKWLTFNKLNIADPYANIIVGAALMAYLMGRRIIIKDKDGKVVGAQMTGFRPLTLVKDDYERWKFALAGYNCGIGHITGKKNGESCWRILRKTGEDYTNFNNCMKVLPYVTNESNALETKNYVDRITKYAAMMESSNEKIV